MRRCALLRVLLVTTVSDRALCALACCLAEGDIIDQPDEGYWLDEARRYLAALSAAGLKVVERS